ncbi:MAG: bifunctional (p)ppGpp synthetase/guanosine-3',5'-bis(diphosphate) 3'-pyrophosphohydrolase [Candidatus Spechtbacteria bacterium]|nr:bifunctional (p)ppGpp synthetase/guanosine-3',5'-bis(diphosphate) 3'-pyrophosphohydrolase [Candidatus Spechtbacteria bacterium]
MSTVKEKTYKEKFEEILEYFVEPKEKDLIQRAFDMAEKSHGTQQRASGEIYIIHPIETALTLAKINMDAQTIAAALLHDAIDDTPLTSREIKKEFGDDIAFLVEGVSKLGKIKYRGVERHAENLRKMLIAMAEDVRVILIKFADRLHNMETLAALPERKQQRIALETLEIYAPIAMRLGVSELAKKLEDLAFPYVYPDKYEYVKKESKERMRDAEKYMKKLLPIIRKRLAKENIRPRKIEIRSKHYYSLWRKLEKNKYNWGVVYDLIAVRIIVDTVEVCYRTLGIVHNMWKPLPGRIKDYIALPKPNGYKSLHTTVFCLDGKITEIQIRTKEMHESAEYGIAAHWRYKNRGTADKGFSEAYTWVKQLQEWKKDSSPTEEFLNSLKVDVFSDRIFVFTPKGDVFDLPQGSTTVDFAYLIHSDIGDKCAGAICNGKLVPLNHELQNGDVVEIITSKNKTPNQAWLSFVKTSGAKNKIRKWFKTQNRGQNIENGARILNDEAKLFTGHSWRDTGEAEKKKALEKCSFENEEELFLAIGQGDITVNRVIQVLIDKAETVKLDPPQGKIHQTKAPVIIAGLTGIKMYIAQCCNPVKPEEIAAYITVDKGASIHKINCPNLRKLEKSEKVLPAYWAGTEQATSVYLELLIANRVGMLEDVTRVIANLRINILGIQAGIDEVLNPTNTEALKMNVRVEIEDLKQLKTLIEKLKTIPGPIEVKRGI